MPIYKLIEYSTDCSEAIGSLWFSSKDQMADFNADIVNNNNFKSFKYKAKLLGNIVAQADNAANVILKNATIAVSSENLSNFWRSFEMSLINCKIELKHKWSN